MPIVVWQTLKEPKHTPVVKGKIQSFLSKLQQDDTTLGLHIEPIANSKDPRVRTGRVDQFWRALLFRFDPPGGEPVYVYAGTWPHDEAIAKAKHTVARQNPVNSLVAFTEVLDDLPIDSRNSSPQVSLPQETVPPLVADSVVTSGVTADPELRSSLLRDLKYLETDLTTK